MATPRIGLRRELEIRGWSLEDCRAEMRAVGCDVTGETISRWQLGKQGISPGNRRGLSRVLRLPLADVHRLAAGEVLGGVEAGPAAGAWRLDVGRLPVMTSVLFGGPSL